MFSSAQQDFQFTPTGHSVKRKNFLSIQRPDKLLKFINKSNCAKFSGSACAIDDSLTFAIFGSSSSWVVGTLWEPTQRSLASGIEQSLKFFPKIWRILLWAPKEFYYAEGLGDTSIRITFMYHKTQRASQLYRHVLHSNSLRCDPCIVLLWRFNSMLPFCRHPM